MKKLMEIITFAFPNTSIIYLIWAFQTHNLQLIPLVLNLIILIMTFVLQLFKLAKEWNQNTIH